MLKIMKGEEGEEGGGKFKKFLKMFGRIFYCFSYCIFSSSNSNSNSKMKSQRHVKKLKLKTLNIISKKIAKASLNLS